MADKKERRYYRLDGSSAYNNALYNVNNIGPAVSPVNNRKLIIVDEDDDSSANPSG